MGNDDLDLTPSPDAGSAAAASRSREGIDAMGMAIVVVPVEPTEEMLRAAVEVECSDELWADDFREAMRIHYAAMLSAAPPASDSDRLRALYQQRADINSEIAELERKLSPEPTP